MTNDIKPLLKRLKIEDTGTYENHFYIVNIADSNEYAKMYTKLVNNTINLEYPTQENDSNKNLIKTTHYFKTTEDDITYELFLIGDLENDQYYLKIGEK
jgi:hypothetical protein